MKFKVAYYFIFTFCVSHTALAQSSAAIAKDANKKPKVETVEDAVAKVLMRAAKYQEIIDNAPKQLAEIQNELNAPIVKKDIASKTNLTLDELTQKKSAIESDLSAKRSEEEALNSKEVEQKKRVAIIPNEIAELKATLATLEPTTEPKDKNLILNQIKALELELKSYSATSVLLTARQQLASKNVAITSDEQKLWQELYNNLLAGETQKARENAESQALKFSAFPKVAALANGNATLAKAREKISSDILVAEKLVAQFAAEFKLVREQKISAFERVELLESSGLSIDSQTGKLLRIQHSKLRSNKNLNSLLQSNIQTSATAQILHQEIKDALTSLPLDLDAAASELATGANDPTVTQKITKNLLIQKRALLTDLSSDCNNYIATIRQGVGRIRDLSNETKVYREFLDLRLLWIPSAAPLAKSDITVEARAIKQLFSEDHFGLWITNLVHSFITRMISWIIFILIITYLTISRKRFNAILDETAKFARCSTCTKIIPTWKALGVTLLLSIPIPITLAFLAWVNPEPESIFHGLVVASFLVFFLGSYRRMAAKNGLLANHFKMNERIVRNLYRHFTWYVILIPVCFFFFFAISKTVPDPQAGRLFFIVLMLITMLFLHCVLRHRTFNTLNPKLTSKFIWLFALLIPLFFLVGSSLGYISSVNTLRQQTIGSICLILVVILIVRILERWILLSRRALAIELARQEYEAKLEIKQLADSTDTTPKETPQSTLEEIKAHAADVVSLESQTKKLIRLGMSVMLVLGIFQIWSSSFTALSVLDNVHLWGGEDTDQIEKTNNGSTTPPATDPLSKQLNSSTQTSTSTATNPESTASTGTSLQDLIMSGIVIALFLAAARNLPGLLELSLLRRLNLEPGGNYAITSVLRYTLVAVGFLIAFSLLGVSWSSVQWLAAAVSLGIGFGLQEIFANFVAGIILLFERPIRLGDIVTVGDGIHGKVTKIRIRATTILQFNERELVVPNKEFITGSLINWTLTSTIQRFDIEVGIASESDSEEATRILLRLASNHRQILDDPKPQVIFDHFGPSSLNFIVRAHVAEVDNLVPTKSELHYQINKAFKKAGIKIAIVQADIRINSADNNELEEREEPKKDNGIK